MPPIMGVSDTPVMFSIMSDPPMMGGITYHCKTPLLYIYLEINTNYVYPCRGPVPSVKDRNHLCRGPEFPLSGTGTPPEGLVMSFQYMQLYLTFCLILFEGLVDEYCQSIQALKSILVSLVS